MASESETMLPCPFCGCVVVLYAEEGAWQAPGQVYCDDCGASAFADAWQKRTPSAEAKDAARLVWVGKHWSDEHSLRYASHVLRVGGIGDTGDMRAYVDAAIAQQPAAPS